MLIKITKPGFKVARLDGQKVSPKLGQYIRTTKGGKVQMIDKDRRVLADLTTGSETIAAKFGDTILK